MAKISSVDLYNFVNSLANKDQDGSFTITQYNDAVFSASNQLFEEYLGEIQKYQYGNPIPPVVYAKTLKIETDLNPFRSPLLTVTSNSSGVIDLSVLTEKPYYITDLYKLDAGVTYPCRRINEQRWASQVSSRVAPPTTDYPYFMVYYNSTTDLPEVKVAPESAKTFKLSYLSLPQRRDVKFTVAVSGRPVITAVGGGVNDSQYLQWSQQNFNDLAMRVISFLGLNLKDNELIQFSERKQIQGV